MRVHCFLSYTFYKGHDPFRGARCGNANLHWTSVALYLALVSICGLKLAVRKATIEQGIKLNWITT